MELPEELLFEILLQLPIRSLLRFKCVCKDWHSLIQSPRFITRQFQLSHGRKNKLLCYRRDPITETHVASVLDRQTLDKPEDLEYPPFLAEEGDEAFETSSRRIEIYGPVNGIYCIHRSLIDMWVGTLTLWNPATRAYKHILPQVSFPFPVHLLLSSSHGNYYDQQDPSSLHIGFGFDHVTNDYKIVVICEWTDVDTLMDGRWHLRVYNHASNTWKTVYSLNYTDDPHPLFDCSQSRFPNMEHCDPPTSHCLLNGVFHWACVMYYDDVDDHCRCIVLAFDISTDIMRLIKGPPLPALLPMHWSLCAHKETIVAVSYVLGSCIDVWMMTEYGVEDSWVFLYSIPNVSRWDQAGFCYDDRIFFSDQNGQLVSSGFDDGDDVKEHGEYGMQDLGFHGIRGSLGVLNYVETLTEL